MQVDSFGRYTQLLSADYFISLNNIESLPVLTVSPSQASQATGNKLCTGGEHKGSRHHTSPMDYMLLKDISTWTLLSNSFLPMLSFGAITPINVLPPLVLVLTLTDYYIIQLWK